MPSFSDRVKDSSATTGTGDLTLSGTPDSGFVAFGTVFAIGEQFKYVIADNAANEWEVGYGHLSGTTTLVRDKVTRSTNSDALVNFSAGNLTVFVSAGSQEMSNGSLGKQLTLNSGSLGGM